MVDKTPSASSQSVNRSRILLWNSSEYKMMIGNITSAMMESRQFIATMHARDKTIKTMIRNTDTNCS